MSLLNNIEKLKSRTFILSFFSILFLISPGIIGVFLFRQDLFLQLDWARLLLLSIAITAPISLMNTFLCIGAFTEKSQLKNNGDFFLYLCMSMIFTGLLVYLFLVISFIINESLKVTLYIAITFEIVFILYASYKDHKKKKLFQR